MKHRHDAAVSSSGAAAPAMPLPSSSNSSNRSSQKPTIAFEDPLGDSAAAASSSPSSDATCASVERDIVRRGEYAAICKWNITNFTQIKSRSLWSRYFLIEGLDCRLLIYPKGDTQALPGYVSIYLQIIDPRNTGSSKWDSFASYRLCIQNLSDDSKSVHRDSWHRFSSKKKSHGWCDFASINSILDPKAGFLHSKDDCILIIVMAMIFRRIMCLLWVVGEAQSGKFTWKVQNFSLFKEMMKTQKIMSPVFPAGECNLRISVYQSVVNGVEYLSMCLESKETEKSSLVSDRSCWCLFRMSVLNQKQVTGSNHVHRDSYGRFATDNKSGDNTSLGWNDYMRMADFVGPESRFLVEDTTVFNTSFHVIKELSIFSKGGTLVAARNGGSTRKSNGYIGKFTWRIENFSRLKDLLKKRKITGLCIKSKRFQIGNQDCRSYCIPQRTVSASMLPFRVS